MKKMSDLLKGTFSPSKTPTGNMAVGDFLRLIEQWQELFSGIIAENSVPHKLNGRSLYVATLHPTLAQELSHMERDILLKIVSKYPDWSNKLQRIYFKYYPGFNINAYLDSLKTEQVLKPTKQVLISPNKTELSSTQKTVLKFQNQDIPDPELKKLLNALIDKL